MAIVFCQVTYNEDEDNTKICVENIRPYVDRCIIIQDGSLSPEMLRFLSEKECEVYIHPWRDSTSEQRNHYLERIQDGDWVVVSDPDEQYDIGLCKDIRKLIAKAEAKGYDMISLNVHDVWVKSDGSKDEVIGDYYKGLIFKYYDGLRYTGQIHETLGDSWRVVRAPSKHFYRHVKSLPTVWRNAVRNHFCCGGGNNLMERNPYWLELRAICSALGIETWYQFRDYLKRGNIDRRLKEWIIRYKDLDEETWHSEIREHYLYYFNYLHPEEAPTKEEIEMGHWVGAMGDSSEIVPKWYPKGGVAELYFAIRKLYDKILHRKPSKIELDYFITEFKNGDLNPNKLADKLQKAEEMPLPVFIAQQYCEILGREVDESGFKAYYSLISKGHITREDLRAILLNSPEYREKKRILNV